MRKIIGWLGERRKAIGLLAIGGATGLLAAACIWTAAVASLRADVKRQKERAYYWQQRAAHENQLYDKAAQRWADATGQYIACFAQQLSPELIKRIAPP